MKKLHTFTKKALSVLLCTLMLVMGASLVVPAFADTQAPYQLVQVPLAPGGTAALSLPSLPQGVTLGELTWTCSNTAIATVDQAGVVTAVSNGICNVRAATQDNSFVNIWVITVKPAQVSAIKVSAGNVSAKQKSGATLQLTATVEPADSSLTYTWESSDTRVATVSQTGLVTFCQVGSAIISARGSNGNSFGEIFVETLPLEKEDIKETYRVEFAAAGTYFILAAKIDGEYVETDYFNTMVVYVEEGDELTFRLTSSMFYPLVNGALCEKEADGYYHVRNIDKDLAIIDNVLPIGSNSLDTDPNTNSAPSFMQRLQAFFKKLVEFFRGLFG